MLKEAINRQAAYKDSFYIYAACGGGRDMMYDVNNALITAMQAATDYFSYGQDKEENNLYYSACPRRFTRPWWLASTCTTLLTWSSSNTIGLRRK